MAAGFVLGNSEAFEGAFGAAGKVPALHWLPMSLITSPPASLDSTIHSGALGAVLLPGNRCQFRVWAPRCERVELLILNDPDPKAIPLQPEPRGYFSVQIDDIRPGTLYKYRLNDDKERPDPASRFQPEDVHGPSQVVDLKAFPWTDSRWRGLSLEDYVFYELHVGTLTMEGTLSAVIPRLDDLKTLGITAVEIMPVAQFPGSRNWGYDGVNLFAVHNTYGGPQELQKLVEACHARGLAAVLDVVYNHLGPEGNYLADFGPYFTDRYHTPWGQAINFDGPQSDEVVHYFVESALQWLRDFHFDALRLDAIHGIFDRNARPFLQILSERVEELRRETGRQLYLIAESDLNDTRVILPRSVDGLGMDAQWSDDFHHSVHALLTGERTGYYQDFGGIEHLATALNDGFVYSGQYSEFRKCRHGNSSRDFPAQQFVVCTQNHDQVGNRMLGERLSQLVSCEDLKLAAGLMLLSPYLPLLFMGEEYGETAPFLYFTSHSDRQLIEAVRKGRKAEFAHFQWQGEPPDPQDERTFQRSKLNWELRRERQHCVLLDFYCELLRLRRTVPALCSLVKSATQAETPPNSELLVLRRDHRQRPALAVFNFADAPGEAVFQAKPGPWSKLLDSAEERWNGPGSEIPSSITSAGKVHLKLGPKSLCLISFS